MTGTTNNTFATLLKWGIYLVLAVVALRILFAVIGIAVGLAAFLLFTVLPLLVVGWLALKAWEYLKRREAF